MSTATAGTKILLRGEAMLGLFRRKDSGGKKDPLVSRFERRVTLFNTTVRIAMVLIYLACWVPVVVFVGTVLRPIDIAYWALGAIIIVPGVIGWVRFWRWFDRRANSVRGSMGAPDDAPATYHYRRHIKGGLREVAYAQFVAMPAIVLGMVAAQLIWGDWLVTSLVVIGLFTAGVLVSYARWAVNTRPYYTLRPGTTALEGEDVSFGALFTDGSASDLLDIGNKMVTPKASILDVLFRTVTLVVADGKGQQVLLRDVVEFEHLKALFLWSQKVDDKSLEIGRQTLDVNRKILERLGGEASKDDEEDTVQQGTPFIIVKPDDGRDPPLEG